MKKFSFKFFKKFKFTKKRKLVASGVCLAIIIISVGILGIVYRKSIASTAREVIYVMRLPIEIKRFIALPPDETILIPVEGVGLEDITDTWHGARSEGRIHEGQDIFAETGTPIYSGTNGYVLAIRYNRLGGNTVTILGSGGRTYYYAHFDSVVPELDRLEYVTPETLLGYVGSTGNAILTPPHLHFGVYTREGAINPMPLLRDR